MLSKTATEAIAKALKTHVANELMNTDEYTSFLHELVPSIITESMGEIDTDLLMELSFSIIDELKLS